MDNILYFQKMRQFFVRKGKKSRIESNFKEYLIQRAVIKKDDLNILLSNAFLNSVPYIKLKTRRRGKRVRYKVDFLEKKRGMSKALLAFSKNISKEGPFSKNFEKELENLSSGKSQIMVKRNEMHRVALKNVPYSWLKKKQLIK